MSQYTLNVNINVSDFPELGNPIYPDKNTAKKVPRAFRDDYKGYMQSCDIGMEDAVQQVKEGSRKGSEITSDVSGTTVHIKLPYEDETSKTYKFLGMDIDENFDAIIKMGEGHVVVGSMFDRERVDKLIEDYHFTSRSMDLNFVEKTLKGVNASIDEGVVRKIATSLKAGSVYSIIKEWDMSRGNDYEDFFSSFVDKIKEDIKGDDGDIRAGGALYSSIILNLVNAEELEKYDIRGETLGGGEAEERILIEYYISVLFSYWSQLSKTYSGVMTQLSALDIWSDLNKKVIGDAEFNRRFRKYIDIMDNTTGEVVGNIASFAGISRNGGVIDQNIVRDQGANNLDKFTDLVNGGRLSSSVGENMRYVLLSMVDDSDIEDIYSLTDEEAQALSALDSLRYIDEEAALSRESYDMNDPDERGLFVKSAIRSYERNFREFKPADNFDVTEALADIVERGDIEANKAVSQDILAVKSEDEVGDIITMSGESVKVSADVQSLKRVMKMINKFSKDILSNI